MTPRNGNSIDSIESHSVHKPIGSRSRDPIDDQTGHVLNDAQSRLNPTRVHRVFHPTSVEEIIRIVNLAKSNTKSISICGGRHAMGGQQFGIDNLQLDMTRFNRLVHLDTDKGLATVESGIQWPKLIAALHHWQKKVPRLEQPWTIREKQSGVDTVSIGGSLAANIHGRGLACKPFVDCIESFQLVDSLGRHVYCSRTENPELFSIAIGGYGLFGIVTHITLRLARRFKVQRTVQRILVKEAVSFLEQKKRDGFEFGDCQFGTDLSGPSRAHPAVAPCYRRVGNAVPVDQNRIGFSPEDWAELYQLSRGNKKQAFELFSSLYLQTNGQVYWSDTHQLSSAFCGYQTAVDDSVGTEMITEVYLDPPLAIPFLHSIRKELAAQNADITYGTIRLIEKDDETFLAWARRRSVCIVANLHCPRTTSGLKKVKQDFRLILDRVIDFNGSFYLTYHRWARADQIRSAYPHILDFFKLKKKYDPWEMFQSSWYQHYRDEFQGN